MNLLKLFRRAGKCSAFIWSVWKHLSGNNLFEYVFDRCYLNHWVWGKTCIKGVVACILICYRWNDFLFRFSSFLKLHVSQYHIRLNIIQIYIVLLSTNWTMYIQFSFLWVNYCSLRLSGLHYLVQVLACSQNFVHVSLNQLCFVQRLRTTFSSIQLQTFNISAFWIICFAIRAKRNTNCIQQNFPESIKYVWVWFTLNSEIDTILSVGRNKHCILVHRSKVLLENKIKFVLACGIQSVCKVGLFTEWIGVL